jgi:CheY-like chemotaxis protein
MPTILVVEDDRYFAGILRDYLIWLGLDVEEASDGLSAWEAFGRVQPDVVLSDVLIPRLDGIALASRIRAHGSAVPIVLMSAVDTDPAAVAASLERTGAEAYLVKPFAMTALHDVLSKHLEGLRADEADRSADEGEDLAVVKLRPDAPLPRGGGVHAGFLAPLMLQLRSVGHTGVLELVDESRWKRIVFREGRPVWADGGSSHDRMGTMLLEEGTITPDQFASAVEAMRSQDIDFGTALIRGGALTNAQLYDQLQRLVERRVCSAFSWSFGEWRLGDSLPKQASSFEVEPLMAIWQGLLAHGDLRSMRADLDDWHDRYVVPTERFSRDWGALKHGDGIGFLGSFLSGRRSVDQLREMEVLPASDLIRALWLLWRAGMIGFAASPPADVDAGAHAALAQAAPTIDVPKIGGSLTLQGERVIRDYLRFWQADFFTIFGLPTDADAAAIAAALANEPLEWGVEEVSEGLPDTLRRKARALWEWVGEARATLEDPKRLQGYRERLAEGLTGIYRKVGGAEHTEAAMFFELGRAFMQNRDYREAEASFRKAVGRDPENAEYLAYQGWAMHRSGGGEWRRQGEDLVRRALRMDPHLAIAHYFDGHLLRDRRHLREAAAAFQRALEFAPRFEPAAKALQQTRELLAGVS